MKYYKRNNGKIYEARETEIPVSENCEEITQAEYSEAESSINEKLLALYGNKVAEGDD
ncbi:MAG: hypothetical protein IJZ35_04955 [Clostridia bacterium]|nr:hypothetical protein [Clostridia bacterium]